MRLDGSAALITGAASGIGRGIAQRFLEAGAAVAIFDIDGERARETARELSALGRVLAIEGDVADESHVESAVRQTAAEFGRLDILINNAAIETVGTVEAMSAVEWDRLLAVNLKGCFLFARHSIPVMRRRGGAIVNISSVHAFISYPATPAYDASKAAMLALTRTMALDHGRDGIRVNAICPGYIDAPLLEKWLETVPDRTQAMADVLRLHPLGRIGTPRDVAEAALFLASPAASFISGATLVVDGAMSVIGH